MNKYKAVLVTFLFLFSLLRVNAVESSLSQNPDTTKSIVEKSSDFMKLKKARHLFLSDDYDNALLIYKELHNNNPHDALLNYRLGECHLMTKNADDAITYLERSIQLNPAVNEEFQYVYGQALHQTGQLEKAKSELIAYKNGLDPRKDKESVEMADKLLKQVNYGLEIIKNPINVTITNAGNSINSQYDEHGASISPDGQQLIFTSRRPDTKGGAKDPNDGLFLEDIYISNWDQQSNSWGMAEPAKGRLNTEDHDGCLGFSPDGTEIFVYRNEGDAGFGSGDIFISKASASGKWSEAKRLGKKVNTSYFESSASMTADGEKMFFISERKGGLGQGDIWFVEKTGKKSWSEAQNIGNLINTVDDERMVYVHPSGKFLFYSSDNEKSIGGYDIFKSEYKDGAWTAGENIGYPINTFSDEINFCLSADAKKAYTSAYKSTGMGRKDIYEIDLSQYALIEIEAPKKITLNGNIEDSEGNPVVGSTIQIFENTSNTQIKELTSDGKGEFSFDLNPGRVYRYIVKKEGYITLESKNIDPKDADGNGVVKNRLILKK